MHDRLRAQNAHSSAFHTTGAARVFAVQYQLTKARRTKLTVPSPSSSSEASSAQPSLRHFRTSPLPRSLSAPVCQECAALVDARRETLNSEFRVGHAGERD